MTDFEISYDLLSAQLTVLQDGQTPGPYSQFSRCSGGDFSLWFENLADYCRTEANGPFDVRVTAEPLHANMLSQVFANSAECRQTDFRDPVVSCAHRLRWANELAQSFGLRLPELAVRSRTAAKWFQTHPQKEFQACSGAWKLADASALPMYLKESGAGADSDVEILASEEQFSAARFGTRERPCACLLLGGAGIRYKRQENYNYLFQCDINSVAKFIRMWLLEFHFPEYLKTIASQVCSADGFRKSSDPLVREKGRLLTDSRPYLALEVDDRIEVTGSGTFTLRKLPEDMRCLVTSERGEIAALGPNGLVKPLKEGRGLLSARPKEDPGLRVEKAFEVYRYRRVNQIMLTPPGGRIMVGDTFSVRAGLSPANANNRDRARWSISPSGVATELSPGNFRAEKPGACTLTLTVENVSESVSLHFALAPTGISFPQTELEVKLGDQTQQMNASILPAGAVGGQVRYRIADPQILDIDSHNGQILTKNEGSTVVTALLLDGSGQVVADCNCMVTVLPPKDIYTPDAPLVLALASLVGMVMLYHLPLHYLLGVLAIGNILWLAAEKKNKKVWILCVIAAVITAGVLVLIR